MPSPRVSAPFPPLPSFVRISGSTAIGSSKVVSCSRAAQGRGKGKGRGFRGRDESEIDAVRRQPTKQQASPKARTTRGGKNIGNTRFPPGKNNRKNRNDIEGGTFESGFRWDLPANDTESWMSGRGANRTFLPLFPHAVRRNPSQESRTPNGKRPTNARVRAGGHVCRIDLTWGGTTSPKFDPAMYAGRRSRPPSLPQFPPPVSSPPPPLQPTSKKRASQRGVSPRLKPATIASAGTT